MFQKISLKKLILIVSIVFTVLLFLSFAGNSCAIQHMLILNDIFSYEDSLDPELCEMIIERVDFFNDSCEPQIEIFDCG
ncbi:MAG: hypothetical protein OEM28_11590 [Nitrosopumilus sp.]|nr:hypothetical protein [Nitrosopumilus sp.]MDH3488520.1 hypothetical protein [Nitrosopumilus sp.]